MPLLDAALAFALTMLAVSTVCAQVITLIQRLTKTRNSTLTQMLGEYFDKEVMPVVAHELQRLGEKVTPEAAERLAGLAEECGFREVFPEAELEQMVQVSTAELTEQLKRSDLGSELLKKLGDSSDQVFAALGARYETVGDRFTESFRANSRKWACVVALLLAVTVNIDSWFIADSYLRKPDVREAVIGRLELISRDYEASLASGQLEDFEEMEEIKDSVAATNAQIMALQQTGLPIGWSYFPHSCWASQESADCSSRVTWRGWLKWIVGVLLTVGCAGLGAPFWYDAVRGVARLAQRDKA